MVSERLNSLDMSCFCSCVRAGEREVGMRMRARGLPSYGVEVKTSSVVKGKL